MESGVTCCEQLHPLPAGQAGLSGFWRLDHLAHSHSNNLQILVSQCSPGATHQHVRPHCLPSPPLCPSRGCFQACTVLNWYLFTRVGVAGTANVQGEDQKKLDICKLRQFSASYIPREQDLTPLGLTSVSNDIMVNSLKNSGKCAVLVSEVRILVAREEKEQRLSGLGGNRKWTTPSSLRPASAASTVSPSTLSMALPTSMLVSTCMHPSALSATVCKYADASLQRYHLRHLQSGAPSTFGSVLPNIKRLTLSCRSLQQDGSDGKVSDVLRPGRELVAAGYCMYGSSANLVLSMGQGVDGYTLDNVCARFPCPDY